MRSTGSTRGCWGRLEGTSGAHGAVEARYLMAHCRRGAVQLQGLLVACEERGRVFVSSESLLALWAERLATDRWSMVVERSEVRSATRRCARWKDAAAWPWRASLLVVTVVVPVVSSRSPSPPDPPTLNPGLRLIHIVVEYCHICKLNYVLVATVFRQNW